MTLLPGHRERRERDIAQRSVANSAVNSNVDTTSSTVPSTQTSSQHDLLSSRLTTLTTGLAAVQMITAGLAAEADAHAHTRPRGEIGSLWTEVKRLRGVVDGLARQALERAFELRDDMDTHR